MFRKKKIHWQRYFRTIGTLMTVALSMKALDDNEYINSLSRGKLYNPCENLICNAAEFEKVFRQHSAGSVREILSEHVREDVLQKHTVKSTWQWHFYASFGKSKISVTDVCWEGIVMLNVSCEIFFYTKEVVTHIKIKEKIKLHKIALRKALTKQFEAKSLQ